MSDETSNEVVEASVDDDDPGEDIFRELEAREEGDAVAAVHMLYAGRLNITRHYQCNSTWPYIN